MLEKSVLAAQHDDIYIYIYICDNDEDDEIYIYISSSSSYIYHSLKFFPPVVTTGFHWSLSDSESLWLFSTLLSILANVSSS